MNDNIFGSAPLAQELAKRHQALSEPYKLSSNPLLDRQTRRESNARSYPRRIPIAINRAAGIYVEDVDQRVFIDCLAGAGSLALGHNHPVVTTAIKAALDEYLPLLTLDLTTPVKDRFTDDLFSLLPSELANNARVQFCSPSGSDAVEAALKLVKTATGGGTVLSFQGAYHGMTQGSLALMGSLGPKKTLNGTLNAVQFLPYPYDYRCPFGLGGEAGIRAGLNYIHSVLNDPEGGVPSPAGMILEPIQGEGGVVVAANSWLQGIRSLTRARRIPLIVDEIQSGFGRTGKMFAFEHAEIIPDVITLSKALGGSLPLSVVIYRAELDQWQPGAHAGTFRGNQLAMAAGSATLRFIQSHTLNINAQHRGKQLIEGLQHIQGLHSYIGDVRGRGLMIGVEIIDPDAEKDLQGHPAANPKLAAALQRACLRHGLIIEVGGRHGSVLRFLPPLIITEQEIAHVLDIFHVACGEVLSPAQSSSH